MTLTNGTTVTIGELSLADSWPYINGQAANPEDLIRAAVIDSDGNRLIKPDESIPMIQALELLPHILKFNHLEADAEGVAELDEDFPRAVSDG